MIIGGLVVKDTYLTDLLLSEAKELERDVTHYKRRGGNNITGDLLTLQ